MPNPDFLKPKPGMTSLEAAALYLSDGETSDPAKAAHYADASVLNIDELQKAHLRRMMGFDWEVTMKDKRMTVYSKEYPYVSKTVKTSGIMNERTVDKLVDLCLEVKLLFEAEKEAGKEQQSDD